MESYDLIVLGGGPAGACGAGTAAAFGKSVALIEKAPRVGGAGVLTGTVPSKTLRETALALSGWRARKLFGVDLSLRREATVADFTRAFDPPRRASTYLSAPTVSPAAAACTRRRADQCARLDL